MDFEVNSSFSKVKRSYMKCQSIVKCKISCRIDLFNLENDLRAISSLKLKNIKFWSVELMR